MKERIRHLWHLALLGRWSPLARMPDLLTVAVILTAYTAWAYHDPAKYISKASIFGGLSDTEQSWTAAACIAACVVAYLWPFPGGWAAMILGLGMRWYDGYAQHSPIAMVIYGIIFALGCVRMVQRTREADLMRIIVAEARVLVREREAVDALLRRWDRMER